MTNPASTIMTRAQFWERHDALRLVHKDNAAFSAAALALHEEYWGAYVKAFNVRAPEALMPAFREAYAAGDVHMNPSSGGPQIAHIDNYMRAISYTPGLVPALQRNGEGWTLSSNVCLIKEAARQQIVAETA